MVNTVEVKNKSPLLSDWLLLVTDCIEKYGPEAKMYSVGDKTIVKYAKEKQDKVEKSEMSNR